MWKIYRVDRFYVVETGICNAVINTEALDLYNHNVQIDNTASC